MQIETLAIDRLIPYARNSRTHSDEQVAQVAASIREFGFTNPVLVDAEGGIIAGHGRVMAARKLGMDKVPCIRLAHLTEAQRRAYVIADNKLALNSGWDDQMLALEFKDLQDMGFDLELTGFGLGDIDELLAELDATPEGATDADETPAMQADAVSQPGDVWMLGKHRIMCGDSTVATHVEVLLAGAVPHLMVTDPPYGVSYDPSWRDGHGGQFGDGKAVNRGKVENDNREDWLDAWTLFPGDVAYVWHGERQLVGMGQQLKAAGFDLRNLIVWAKPSLTFGRGHYHSQHETCWYAVKKGGTGHWGGDRKQTTLWQIAGMNPAGRGKTGAQDDKTGHGTQKPVDCMRIPIENNSVAGDSIYEPFSGSGTTIIAAEQTGRRCYAMELSPNYVDVAVRRWQQYTGKRAVHAETGREFGE